MKLEKYALIALVLPSLLIGPALTHAQSQLTGTWQNEVLSGGLLQLWTVELDQDGTNLTGSVEQGVNDNEEIYEGEIRGDTIVFKVNIPGHRTITFTGEVNRAEIAFTRDVEVQEGGDPGGPGIYGASAVPQFTVTRVPDGQAPAEPRGVSFPRQLTVFDRDGEVLRTLGEPADYAWPVFSPDGQRLAVVRPDPTPPWVTGDVDPEHGSEVREIWVFDLATGARTLVTSGPVVRTPVWSPDGGQIAYFSYREDHGGLYRKASNGTGIEERLYQFPLGVGSITLDDWSADGRFLAFGMDGVLSVLPLDGERKAVELVREEYGAFGGGLSLESRFFAYMSNESGRWMIYVQAFDPSAVRLSTTGELWQVAEGSSQRSPPNRTDRRVHWRQDAGELYYQNGDLDVMAVEVSTTPAFQAGPSRLLFRAPSTGLHRWNDSFLSISGDGEQFVIAVLQPPARRAITVAPEILAKYAGTYVLEPDLIDFVMTLEGNQLWSQAAFDEEKVGPMLAKSETSFYFERFGEEIDFVMDDQGNVTHLISFNNGVGRRAARK